MNKKILSKGGRAVNAIFDSQTKLALSGSGRRNGPADWKSAIQQIRNLRYSLIADPDLGPS
jgi:hypothetical protein